MVVLGSNPFIKWEEMVVEGSLKKHTMFFPEPIFSLIYLTCVAMGQLFVVTDEMFLGDNPARKIDKVSIYFATSTGTSEKFAKTLAEELNTVGVEASVTNMADVEAEEQLPAMAVASKSLLVLIASTYTDGIPPESGKWFFGWLSDSAQDFRFDFCSHYSILHVMSVVMSWNYLIH